jgi:hypothetical protein
MQPLNIESFYLFSNPEILKDVEQYCLTYFQKGKILAKNPKGHRLMKGFLVQEDQKEGTQAQPIIYNLDLQTYSYNWAAMGLGDKELKDYQKYLNSLDSLQNSLFIFYHHTFHQFAFTPFYTFEQHKKIMTEKILKVLYFKSPPPPIPEVVYGDEWIIFTKPNT